MMSGGMIIIKFLLFLFNFIFWLSGIGILVAGSVIQIRFSNYINFMGDNYFSAPTLLIVVGCTIAIIGFFGCCGAVRENYCMMMTFAILLGAMFILEIAAGIAAYILREDVGEILQKQARDGQQVFEQPGSEGVTIAWNRMQQDFECCGVAGYSDWLNTTYGIKGNRVPESCCKNKQPSCGLGTLANEALATQRLFLDGCLNKLTEWMQTNAGIVGGIAVGVAFIQVIGMLLACCFASSLRRNFYDSV